MSSNSNTQDRNPIDARATDFKKEPSSAIPLARAEYEKRPVFAIRNAPHVPKTYCVSCTEEIADLVFIGVQYTYDDTKFSPLCVECGRKLGIVQSETVKKPPKEKERKKMTESTDTSLEAPKKRRGRPPGSGKHQRAAALAAQLEQEGKGEPIMGLLSKKLSPSTTATAPTPEEKVSSLLVQDIDTAPFSLEVDDEEEQIELVSSAVDARIEEDVVAPVPSNPVDLRSRIESVETGSAKQSTTTTTTVVSSGITKADVQEIVEAVLAELTKDIASQISKLRSSLKAEFSEALKGTSTEITNYINAQDTFVVDHLSVIGSSIADLTKTLNEALSDSQEDSKTTPAPATVAQAPAAAATATSKPSPMPSTKVPFAEFLRQHVGEDGIRLEPLADAMVEHNYFKSVPEDTAQFYAELSNMLRQRGYQVVDYFVTPASK